MEAVGGGRPLRDSGGVCGRSVQPGQALQAQAAMVQTQSGARAELLAAFYFPPSPGEPSLSGHSPSSCIVPGHSQALHDDTLVNGGHMCLGACATKPRGLAGCSPVM